MSEAPKHRSAASERNDRRAKTADGTVSFPVLGFAWKSALLGFPGCLLMGAGLLLTLTSLMGATGPYVNWPLAAVCGVLGIAGFIAGRVLQPREITLTKEGLSYRGRFIPWERVTSAVAEHFPNGVDRVVLEFEDDQGQKRREYLGGLANAKAIDELADCIARFCGNLETPASDGGGQGAAPTVPPPLPEAHWNEAPDRSAEVKEPTVTSDARWRAFFMLLLWVLASLLMCPFSVGVLFSPNASAEVKLGFTVAFLLIVAGAVRAAKRWRGGAKTP